MTAAKRFLTNAEYLINLSEVSRRTGIGYGRLVYIVRSRETDFEEEENQTISGLLNDKLGDIKKLGQS